MKPYQKLLLALVAGAVAGLTLHNFESAPWLTVLNNWFFQPVGQIFLRLIFMAVVPLVFCGLVVGVFELSKHQGLGSVARRTLFFTLVTSTLSVILGVGLTNLLQPGRGLQVPVPMDSGSSVEQLKSSAAAAKSLPQTIIEIIPTNPIAVASRALEGEMIALMFFALVFGVALSHVRSDKGSAVLNLMEEIFEASMEIVKFAMKLAPVAVFSLVFVSVSKFGLDLIISLSFYVLVVVGALLIQQLVVYSSLLRWNGFSPLEFYKQCREVYLYAFATASSNATLPLSIETAEKKLKLPSETSRFVLTVGSTANQNGTALFEGVTVLFLAQVYGVDLTLGQQVLAVVMSILAGVGTAGVPGGSLPLIMILLQQLGIPAEGVALILGVDRFLDMCRTTINVSGDLVIAALVGKPSGASARRR